MLFREENVGHAGYGDQMFFSALMRLHHEAPHRIRYAHRVETLPMRSKISNQCRLHRKEAKKYLSGDGPKGTLSWPTLIAPKPSRSIIVLRQRHKVLKRFFQSRVGSYLFTFPGGIKFKGHKTTQVHQCFKFVKLAYKFRKSSG
jgi:hypothetical protein